MGNRFRSFALLLAAPAIFAASGPGPSAEGRWLTEKKGGIVEIFRCAGNALCGRLVWFRMKPADRDKAAVDVNNPAPEQRNRPLCGLVMMQGFKPAEPGTWQDGNVYDPESGNTYRGTMKLQADGTLRLRGYIGISLIGASETWTRYHEALPQCPTR